VRPRARLLPLGSRLGPITPTDSPPPAGVRRRRAPKSAGTRAVAMGSPHQATPARRQASAGDATRDLGCQSPHMRLTDVEDALGVFSPQYLSLYLPKNGGALNAARLTTAPPYEQRRRGAAKVPGCRCGRRATAISAAAAACASGAYTSAVRNATSMPAGSSSLRASRVTCSACRAC
jgi:hypothetical protein